jgi:hypothetical protein
MLDIPTETQHAIDEIQAKVDALVARLEVLHDEDRRKNYPALRLAVDLQNTMRSHIDDPPT